MGWFDKKSWQLRRKIKDLQAELAIAEREGKYVVCQGLFFAELQEMGNDTLMVLGKADTMDTEEETVIRSFFERNGFSVESLRLDKAHKTLAQVEIVPPEEFTRHVARDLKNQGYKLIDDSENEKESNLAGKVITLSALVRSISGLFASHVHNLIVTTPIKMNMEGNRLLHWMPLIRDALLPRVPAELVTLNRQPFIDAYNHYYGRFGQLESCDGINLASQDQEVIENPIRPEMLTDSSSSPAPWTGHIPPAHEPSLAHRNLSNDGTSRTHEPPTETSHSQANARAVQAGQSLARMYKSLIGASAESRTTNSTMLLNEIAEFFGAKSASLLHRNTDNAFTILASSDKSQAPDSNLHAVDSPLLGECLEKKRLVRAQPTNGNSNPSSVAAPITTSVNSVLYLYEPIRLPEQDDIYLEQFAQVFAEFTDLLIPVSEKV